MTRSLSVRSSVLAESMLMELTTMTRPAKADGTTAVATFTRHKPARLTRCWEVVANSSTAELPLALMKGRSLPGSLRIVVVPVTVSVFVVEFHEAAVLAADAQAGNAGVTEVT